MVISNKRKRRSINGKYTSTTEEVKVLAGLNPYSLMPIYTIHQKPVLSR